MHLLDDALAPRLELASDAGHVESWFAMLQAPDGERAIWLKQTALVRRDGSAEASSWAIRFDARAPRPPQGLRATFPLSEALAQPAPARIATAASELRREADQVRWSGHLSGEGEAARWDVRLRPLAPPVRLLPRAWMYEAPFPRSKTLTPVPDALASGELEWAGQRWDVSGWRALLGHNWGTEHAPEYVWIAWVGELPDGAPMRCEAVAARVGFGPVRLPWLGVARIEAPRGTRRFAGPGGLGRPAVEVGPRAVTLRFRDGGEQLELHVRIDRSRMARLPYEGPDGSLTWCLNTKLAWGRLRWKRRRHTLCEHAGRPVAVEIGTRGAVEDTPPTFPAPTAG